MIKHFKILKLISKYAKYELFLVTFFSLIYGCVLPVQTYLLNCIVASISESISITTFIVYLCFYIIMIIFLEIRTLILDSSKLLLLNKLTETFDLDILTHISCLNYNCFEKKETQDLINRFKSPSKFVVDEYYSVLSIVQLTLSLFGLVILFYNTAPSILFVTLILFTIALMFNLQEVSKLRNLQVKHSLTERKTDYISNLFVDKSAAKEINIFNLKRHLLDNFEKLTLKMIHERNIVRRKGFFGGVISQLFNALFVIIGVIVLINLLTKGQISLAQAVALVSSFPALGLIASFYLPNSIMDVKQKNNFLQDYELLMNLPRENKKEDIQNITSNNTIKFDNVCFTYPGTKTEILTNVSFEIKQGETVAIVGENGCGKSTIIKLILGLYPVNSGYITIGGKSPETLSKKDYKKLFSALFQDINIYDMSIKENINLSNAELFDVTKLEDKLAKTDFLSFIEKMPNRYNSNIGRLYQDGTDLSGGERQRLALLRVIYSSSDYAIMDEPTAAMDPITEVNLYKNLFPIFKNRSIIIVSHRLAAAKIAHKILVVKDGKIIESGTHKNLMHKKGYYYEMFESQANWYRRKE